MPLNDLGRGMLAPITIFHSVKPNPGLIAQSGGQTYEMASATAPGGKRQVTIPRKKIGGREMKLAMIALLVHPIMILWPTGLFSATDLGNQSRQRSWSARVFFARLGATDPELPAGPSWCQTGSSFELRPAPANLF